ncbi:MAG: hypothetical protein HC850_16435 [Rhodomicrobium sp.]|nr:hypothetical protein [Rhodomicrobium sp.]
MAKFELVIENRGTVSFIELREIVAIIDGHIAQDLRRLDWPRYGPDDWFAYPPDYRN